MWLFLDTDECSQLCKLTFNYLGKLEGCENSIYMMFSQINQ